MKKKKFRDKIITTSDLPDVLPDRSDEKPEKLTIISTNPKRKKKFTSQILTTKDVAKKEEKDEKS